MLGLFVRNYGFNSDNVCFKSKPQTLDLATMNLVGMSYWNLRHRELESLGSAYERDYKEVTSSFCRISLRTWLLGLIAREGKS